jgi:Patatin-like phospholipase
VDPCTELATRVVSYLWVLRDLFPQVETVGEFDLARLPARVDDDMALLARLRNMARRDASERWTTEARPRRKGRSRRPLRFERLDDALQEIVSRRKRREADTDTRFARFRATVAYTVGLQFGAAEARDLEALRRYAIRPFRKHAFQLIALFGSQRPQTELGPSLLPGREVSRESLADEIARVMLDTPGLLYRTAQALDYKPILLRTVDGGEAELQDSNYPQKLLAQCRNGNHAVPFQLLLHDELDEIERSRELRLGGEPGAYAPAQALTRADGSALIGLAFSGGGIRSATFNLGVLQGLCSRGWLPHFDYLSTVSGGGYIGSWLLAWIKRRGSVAAVQESLRGLALSPSEGEPLHRNPDPGAEHVRPIRLLREYSNYLAPRLGAFSADSWTIVSIWLRNTVMNLIVLMLFLMGALIAPRLLGLVFDDTSPWSLTLSMVCLIFFLGLTSVLIGLNLRSFDDPAVTQSSQRGWRLFRPRQKPSERGDTPFIVIATIVVPCLIAVFFATRALWQHAATAIPYSESWADQKTAVFWWSFGLLAGGLTVTALFAQLSNVPSRGERLTDRFWFRRIVRNSPAFFGSVAWGIAAAAVGAFLIKELWDTLLPVLFADTHRGIWIGIGLGPVLLLTVITVVIVIYLGLEGLSSPDERREWWSRLGAWLGLMSGAWVLVSCISFFVPYFVATAWLYAGTLGIGWTALTGIGAWLGSSGESNGINLPLDKRRLTSLIITIAPYLFIAGVLVVVAVLTHASLYLLAEEDPFGLFTQRYTAMGRLPFSVQRYADTYWAFVQPHSNAPALLCLILLALSAVLAGRADVNEFSMHHFYKNRLVRAYLGASRTRVNRRPNAFTGLDMDDDIKLWRFTARDPSTPEDERTDCRAAFAGPYAIINTTLNMTTGDELAWQERKGQSFVFTPLYSGFDFATKQALIAEKVAAQFAYRPTRTFGNSLLRPGVPPRIDEGLGIGTAVAISGAAANPNAGYHSSPAVAFFLTMLNARLGWWIGNPMLDRWYKQSPPFGLFYLLSELFGFAGVKRKFVNLSDGGHFDNMGLYELVRRRCRLVVVCDGEQDDRYSFNGIAGAIRKCRVDFGVVIDLPTEWIDPRRRDGRTGRDAAKENDGKQERSRCHVAVGTIKYPGGVCGTIVYVKASLTGNEPSDVIEYRDRHPEFPHQTTADQFFDESQFESYRALGQHIIDTSFVDWPVTTARHSGEDLDRLATAIRAECKRALATDGPAERIAENG